jgi:hypothetical protein
MGKNRDLVLASHFSSRLFFSRIRFVIDGVICKCY